MSEMADTAYVTASGQVGPQVATGVRTKYVGAAIAMTAGTTAQVRIRANGVITGRIIDTFFLNANLPTAQHMEEPGVNAGTGIYVEVVSGTVDVVVSYA